MSQALSQLVLGIINADVQSLVVVAYIILLDNETKENHNQCGCNGST